MTESVPNQNPDSQPVPPVDVPDPNGEPVSQTGFETAEQVISAGILYAMAGGAGLYLLGLMMTPCMGATRSSRLLREQRQQEISEAIAHYEATQSTDSAASSQATPVAEDIEQ